MPELSVKSPFNLYHATKFAHSAELCAPARATHVKTSNARKSRMQRRPRAFIHFTREMVFFIVLY